ncbi:uncharacterized protein LOC111749762 isoform X2 [Loxodonta africana]|uniref:uncharacterized protein LOC111749762 isoform X2 n=1 Tax=Loxodonta africana TaxID=9785 RepID=UPI0030D14288
MKARLQSRPRCTSAGSWDRPAGASGRRGGRAGCTGRSGPGGGWDLKVPLHLLPVLGPGTLEEPGWRLQKIPGWRKQPRARVAAAGVSERDEPPETEPRPRPAPSPLHAPPPSSVGWLRAPGAGVTSGKVGAQRRFRVSGASIRTQEPQETRCHLWLRDPAVAPGKHVLLAEIRVKKMGGIKVPQDRCTTGSKQSYLR